MRLLLCLFLLLGLLGQSANAAPNAPSGLTATLDSYTSLTLTWLDNANNEVRFLIGRRGANDDGFSAILSVAANTTSTVINNPAGHATDRFVVVALDAADGQSVFSNIVTPLGIASANFRAAYPQTPFSFNLASSFPAFVTGYAATNLPAGLTLNPATGLISGTPTGIDGKTSSTVTIFHTLNRTHTGPLTIRLFVPSPALLPPVLFGPPPAAQTLALGSPPAAISLSSLFTDPDVASAARLTTDEGSLDFVFYPNSAPQTVTNFIGYLSRGDFTNTCFHRSIPNFIIQAGAFLANPSASAVATQPPVRNEPNITNAKGTIAMAKVGGNPDSATNQFFVNLADNGSNLDNQNEGFTVFARLAGNGISIANTIAALPRRNYSSINGALTDTPVRGTPPASYDPTALVRISQVALVPPLTFSAVSAQPNIASISLTGSTLTLAPIARGTTTITLTATDLDNQVTTTTFPVTVQDAYEAWAAAASFLLPADTAPEADPDGDSLPNLIEFALATSPLAASASPLQPSLETSHLTLTFSLRNELAGSRVTLQSAESLLGPWTDRWSTAEGFPHSWISSRTPLGLLSQIIARDPEATPPNRRFLRLKVSRAAAF